MGTITISIDDEVEKQLRQLAEERGGKKGDLGKVVGEAVSKLAEENKQKEIRERMIARMEKGLYRLPKNWKFNRNELYDRG